MKLGVASYAILAYKGDIETNKRETMKIEIKIRDVWGVTKYYPENESAKIFAELLGQKTLTEQNLRTIKKLGCEIISVARTSDDLLADLITN